MIWLAIIVAAVIVFGIWLFVLYEDEGHPGE